MPVSPRARPLYPSKQTFTFPSFLVASMPFHIKNPDTDALARKLAGLKKIGITEAVHLALANELEREAAKPSLPDVAATFCRALRDEARGSD